MKEKTGTLRKRLMLIAILSALYAVGCFENTVLQTESGPLKTTNDIYDKGYRLSSVQYDGVDLLVVLDNSYSMAEEQQILATHFFPLINSLTKPVQGDPSWFFPAVENLKVAVVTTDIGLQYGESGDIWGVPNSIPTCEESYGDNGNFRTVQHGVSSVNIENGVIKCDPLGDHCPAGYTCESDGFCYGSGSVACTTGVGPVLSTNAAAPNSEIAAQAACTAMQGTNGCGFEQPLEAIVKAFKNQPSFAEESHVLAVIVVSDEEDCSIEDPGLFSSENWLNPRKINIACNYPNNNFLFDTVRYREKLLEAKGGIDEALVFSAIVGVPPAVSGEEAVCEGSGAELSQSGCLDRDEMQITPVEFVPDSPGTYEHFAPACQRKNSSGQVDVTLARPGRRFVETAEQFGSNGFVHSICNEDWSPALLRTGEAIASKLNRPCFPHKAPWTEQNSSDCPNCGVVADTCDLFVEYSISNDDLETFRCPQELYEGLDENTKDAYENKTILETSDQNTKVFCAVPKVATPLACADALTAEELEEEIGWTYCEQDERCEQMINTTKLAKDIAAGHPFAYRCVVEVN